jgi:hypothetical protein
MAFKMKGFPAHGTSALKNNHSKHDKNPGDFPEEGVPGTESNYYPLGKAFKMGYYYNTPGDVRGWLQKLWDEYGPTINAHEQVLSKSSASGRKTILQDLGWGKSKILRVQNEKGEYTDKKEYQE